MPIDSGFNKNHGNWLPVWKPKPIIVWPPIAVSPAWIMPHSDAIISD
jgi:hypothetical protein